MKYVLIVLMGAFLTGCGGVNQWNHNRIRKVKVVYESSETVDLKRTIDPIDFQSDLTTEDIVRNDDVLVEEVDHLSGEQAIEEIAKEEKVEPTAARSFQRENTKNLEIKKTKKPMVEYRSKGASLRKFSSESGWDWATILGYAIAIGIIGLIALGFVFIPNFGAVLLIIGAVIIVALALFILYCVVEFIREVFSIFE